MGGISYRLIDGATHALSMDGGLGYVNERRSVGPDVSSGTYAFGGKYRWTFSPTAEFSEDARLIGNVCRGWRLAR